MRWAKRWGSSPSPIRTPGLQPRDGSVTLHAVSGTGHVQCAAGHRGWAGHPWPQHPGHGGMGARAGWRCRGRFPARKS